MSSWILHLKLCCNSLEYCTLSKIILTYTTWKVIQDILPNKKYKLRIIRLKLFFFLSTYVYQRKSKETRPQRYISNTGYPWRGKGNGCRNGLSRFSLYTLASLSLLKTTYLCRTYTVSKREKVIKWHLNRHWLILGI